MSIANWFTVAISLMQLGAGIAYFINGQPAYTVFWTGIVIANIGLIWSTY